MDSQIRLVYIPLSQQERNNVITVTTPNKCCVCFLWHSRCDRHQELVEASEEDVGNITDPDVSGSAHEEQQARLQRRDDADDELRPDVPTDFGKPRHEGGACTCRAKAYTSVRINYVQSGSFHFRPVLRNQSVHVEQNIWSSVRYQLPYITFGFVMTLFCFHVT